MGAIPIYPIKQHSVYVLSPHAKLSNIDGLNAEFKLLQKTMPEYKTTLAQTVSNFSSQYSLKERIDCTQFPIEMPKMNKFMVRLVCWLYRRKFLLQLHTYPVLTLDESEPLYELNLADSDSNDESTEGILLRPVAANSVDSRTTDGSRKFDLDSPTKRDMSWVCQLKGINMCQRRSLKEVLTGINEAYVYEDTKNALLAFKNCLSKFNGDHHCDEIYWRLEQKVRNKFDNYMERLQNSNLLVMLDYEDEVCAPFVTDTLFMIPGIESLS